MSAIEDLKKIVDEAQLEKGEMLKNQLEVLGKLPGKYNQQVFDKLLELAKYDAKAIPVFVTQFIKTAQQIMGK